VRDHEPLALLHDNEVDFELPTAEKTSWWRLAGYGTESSASSESSDNEESKGAGSESEMEIDD